MRDILTRRNIQETMEVRGYREKDFLDSPLAGMEITKSPQYFTVTQDYAKRPDRLSYDLYGTVKLWWLLCAVNNIVNPFEELVPGITIKVPRIEDIHTFIKSNQK